MSKLSLFVAMIAVAGCGGNGSGNSVSGNIGGGTLAVADAVSVPYVAGASSDGATAIVLSNSGGVCADFTAGQQPPNVQALTFEVFRIDDSGHPAKPTAVGGYPIVRQQEGPAPSGNTAIAAFTTTDASCEETRTLDAITGSITLERLDATGYAGIFDLTFDSGDHVTGRFDAPTCAAPSQALTCRTAKK